MTGCNKQFGAGVFYLLGFNAAVEDSFLVIRGRPRAAARAATEIVDPVRIHFYKVFAALLSDPPGFLIICLAENTFAFPAVIARVVVSGKVGVHRFIYFDAPLNNIFLQKIVNREKLYAFIREPFLETKPGRKVCMPSLG